MIGRKLKKIQNRIAVLEGDADVMKKQIRQNLPKSIFLPVPRTDLLEVVRMQDKIANRAKDIAGLMLGRQMLVPEIMQSDMTEYVRVALTTSEQALTALKELDELVNSGFGGHEIEVIEKMLDKLDQLEHSTDEHERAIRSKLFSIEKELPPIDVMFLYQVITLIGDLADRAQQVGSRLQLLVAR
jgi:predicted phosphate transport protein (TIGR00153 family)